MLSVIHPGSIQSGYNKHILPTGYVRVSVASQDGQHFLDSPCVSHIENVSHHNSNGSYLGCWLKLSACAKPMRYTLSHSFQGEH